ncbi:DNA polymerase III subunit beta [SAR202 cluster bacterium AD-802-E10_MRT_200m]|nr:DNA polymerase III subunit beta [SAR202 cluster bacterium AD-802-E10_MRT_200m]
MKVTCLQETLNKALNIVGRAVATRTTLPVTQNVLIKTDQSMVKLAATNLEMAMSTWVGGDIEEEGAISVPARLLSDFVNSLPGGQIEFTSGTAPYSLHIKCGRYEARIVGVDPNEFPPIPILQGDTTIQLDPKELKSALSDVVFAAATEDSRPVLTGVNIEFQESGYTFVAADGFRLAVKKGQLSQPVSNPIQVIIPAKVLSELNRLLNEQESDVKLELDAGRGQIVFKLDDVELIAQLVQGSFPNYSQLVPETYTSQAHLNVPDLLMATRSASVFARDGNGIIRLHMVPGSPGVVRVIAEAQELGENASEFDAQIEGDEAKVAFSSRYLLDVLGVLGGGNLSLQLTTPSSPGVFRRGDSDDYVHVIMPMFVQW